MNRHCKFLKIVGLLLAVAVSVAGCGASGGSYGGEPESDTSGWWVSVGDTWALVWGEGDRGVVLAHGAAYDAASWESQGQALEENGMVALAVEDVSPGSLRFAIDYLKEEYDVESVALVGASAGAGPVLEVAEEDPEEIGQIMLLSGTGDVSGLGDYPKLFVASEGEEISERVRRMAEEAPGDRNEALILPGSAHAQAIFRTEEGDRLMQTILERLEEHG
ncbi:MAG: alpha/beta hydrolase [Rubrobacter sp.]|nr:alpha/beta hydrolase [Rubrobacter sp.]MDQ3639704.1 alpha/beta hydrolase [Actinomycetota bacterium]